ncbi:MAG: hypothetical protein Q9M37_05585 [Desulfonauticus sp.]|nr:hypothetical protein [Desulfonauticus sp.]
MDKLEKQALQVAKEIVVKFIEVGRISPSNFPDNFALIYKHILKTIRDSKSCANSQEQSEKIS